MADDNIGEHRSRPSTSTRGLFVDGQWQCDCVPRLPAVHFQTKNGGKNHGRWFYTCSRSQRNRCEFFLWDDEAKRRSGQTLLAGSRSEVKNISDNEVGFKTPTTSRFKDMMPTSGLLTPQTGHRKRMRDGEDSAMAKLGESPPKVQRTGERRASSSLTGWLKGGKDPTGGQKRAFHEEGDTSFEWDTEMDDEVPDLEPEKNEKKDSVQEAMSPSKPSTLLPPGRQISAPHTTAMTGNSRSQPPTKLPPRLSAIRSPSPPQISVVRPAAPQPTAPPNLVPSTFNPPPTPAPTRFKSTPLLNRYQTRPQDSHDSQLIGQTLTLLTAHQVPLTEETKSDLVNLLNMHDLRTLGIKKGRDISRMAIKTRDEEIQKLREKIESLEAERESWRIGSLKEHVNGDQDRGRRGR